ncbi:Phosphatidylinositol 3,4,5-trisphosphate-dependent Rac exchanger 2 protein [Candidozyma auris]|uniref:Exonuclease domain-containing protein n=2 Tax=Candidozyma auris TaxID=498019 RepID=A0A2H0ZU44_CANAR|nr:hypothetical_protein [[Candida] auris]KNE01112.2 hypothetical protein QG37_01988 [[Candida] auris]PIS51685.1 hypothetical protein B9J08_003282 [[Candida] auris]PIS53673.1 hypothetical protein CJI97_003357 [[Candida] auris]QEO20988.1 hypothetical_protein [[Candida] auris]GBL48498.1 putative oligoribonuclease [[Candida] auris]
MFSMLTGLFRRAPAAKTAARVITTRKNSIFMPLVWIDCEMTGLNVETDHIIEICCIITDGNLNVVDPEGYESTVYVPKRTLDNMNEWCVNQHGKSGLTSKVLANPQQTLRKVENELLEYIQKYIPEPRTSLLAGNSIHMDKFFMMKEFPRVIEHLHYRLMDVSTIMEMGMRHNPKLMKRFPRKKGNHTARSDILESIAQLKWYREHYLRGPEETSEEKAKTDKETTTESSEKRKLEEDVLSPANSASPKPKQPRVMVEKSFEETEDGEIREIERTTIISR